MCSGLLLAQHSKSQVFHWLLISWPFTFIWHNPEVLIFQGHFVPIDKLTEHKLSCYFLQAKLKAFLVFISGMGQSLIILTSGKILSTSTLGIWYLWLKNFSFCDYLKHRTKLLRYPYIFNNLWRHWQKPLLTALMSHVFYIFILWRFLFLGVELGYASKYSLFYFRKCLRVCSTICILFDVFFVKSKTQSSWHFNWDWTRNMKQRENMYLSHLRACHGSAFTQYV